MESLVIQACDPRLGEVVVLLEQHLAHSRSDTPPEDVHALDLDGLLDPSVTFMGARIDGELVAIGALRVIHAEHVELKSMHTSFAARSRGIGRAMVDHLVAIARSEGYRRISLETGRTDAFVAARALYERAGFVPCERFGSYPPSDNSVFMTLEL